MTPDPNYVDIEAAVGRTFSIPMTPRSRAFVDSRVEAAVSDTAHGTPRGRDRRFRVRSRRLLLGLVAAVVFTGTAVAGGTLFDRLISGAPFLENVWDRATEIGQSTTDAGYTIVLERAAADPERIWVAVSVTAASGAYADPGRMRVIDANGVVMDGGVGVTDADVRGVSATLVGFQVPDGVTPHGPFILEVTSVMTAPFEMIRGDWTFTFDVPLTSAAY